MGAGGGSDREMPSHLETRELPQTPMAHSLQPLPLPEAMGLYLARLNQRWTSK